MVVQHGRRWPGRRKTHVAHRLERVEVQLSLVRDLRRVGGIDHGLLVACDSDWWGAALSVGDAVEVRRGQNEGSAGEELAPSIWEGKDAG